MLLVMLALVGGVTYVSQEVGSKNIGWELQGTKSCEQNAVIVLQ